MAWHFKIPDRVCDVRRNIHRRRRNEFLYRLFLAAREFHGEFQKIFLLAHRWICCAGERLSIQCNFFGHLIMLLIKTKVYLGSREKDEFNRDGFDWDKITWDWFMCHLDDTLNGQLKLYFLRRNNSWSQKSTNSCNATRFTSSFWLLYLLCWPHG